MDRIELGNRIRKIRDERKVTREKVHELTGISVSGLKQLELGETSCKLETLEKLANCFNVNINDIIPTDEIYIELENTIESSELNNIITEQKLFYPNYNDSYEKYERFPIKTLFDFLLYLPLMDLQRLADSLNRIQGSFLNDEYYICKQLEYNYKHIEDKEARRFADIEKQKVKYDFYKKHHLNQDDDLSLDNEEYNLLEKKIFKKIKRI